MVDYAIYLLDPKGHVVSWNPGAERIKGYTADEIIGDHLSRFYTEEDRAAGVLENALKIAAETGRFTTEAWRCRKDGSRFWAMVVIDAIRRGDRLIGFAKITRDMTERWLFVPRQRGGPSAGPMTCSRRCRRSGASTAASGQRGMTSRA